MPGILKSLLGDAGPEVGSNEGTDTSVDPTGFEGATGDNQDDAPIICDDHSDDSALAG